MGIIKPTVSEIPDAGDMLSTGIHVVQCTAVIDMEPDRNRPGSKSRLRFEFRALNTKTGESSGKSAVIVCTASVFFGNGNIRESKLVSFARQAGMPNIDVGIDPEWFWLKWFVAKVGHYNGKAFVRSLRTIPEPAGTDVKTREQWVRKAIAEQPLPESEYDTDGQSGDTPF